MDGTCMRMRDAGRETAKRSHREAALSQLGQDEPLLVVELKHRQLRLQLCQAEHERRLQPGVLQVPRHEARLLEPRA